MIALEGGPYVHKYRAAQFHFHWGKTSQEGAEHLIDGKAYAAEVSSILTCHTCRITCKYDYLFAYLYHWAPYQNYLWPNHDSL